jgi:DNA-binding GntR family transcriptional regulator
MVSHIDLAAHMQMLEVRGQLELLVGRTAALRASDEQRRKMLEVADAIEAAAERGDKKLFMDDSWDSHNLPVAATHNDSMAAAFSLFVGQSRRFWFAHCARFANIREVAALHAARLRAIAGGDPDEAEACSRRLMSYLERFARSTVDDGVRRA